MLGKDILVVEAHADDAFLSLGWHIEKLWRDRNVTILTVYCDAKRAKEAAEYASVVGCKSICLNLEPEHHLKDKDAPVKPVKELQKWLDNYATKYSLVIFPLGLQHPEHKNCAECYSDLLHKYAYLDTPYQSKPMNAEELQEKARNLPIESIVFPSKLKWRRKEIFKSQSKFFHFNNLEDTKLPEIILRLP